MLTASFRPPSGGWYTRPPPPMQRRGRSRQVSAVALARLASEERRQSQREQEKHFEPQVPPNADIFLFPVPPSSSLLLQLEKADPDSSMNVLYDVSHSSPAYPSQPTPFPSSVTDSPCTSPLSARALSPTPGGSVGSSDSSTTVSLSPDSYDSPPSPPRSLEDQVQVAYALDDIRLAKILLLKLKGIEVTSDTDPRIDEVRDEDFDMCFVPSGPLTLEEADKRAVQETQRKQREWWEESQRTQRLRACEKIWEEEKQRLHDERLHAIRKREEEVAHEEERRRILEVQLRTQVERELQERTSRVRLERYSSTKQDEDPFQYSFMPPTKASNATPSRRSFGSPKATKKVPTRSPGSLHRSVSFKEVINSMNGKLFPQDPSERAEDARRIVGLNTISSPTHHRRKASVRAELLDSLLQVVEWQEGERRRTKGKDVEGNPQFLKSPVYAPTPMPSVPSSESVTSMSSSSPTSRSSSWLSFGSWRSSGTDVTTPDSPLSASPNCSVPCPLPNVIESQHDTHPRCSFVRISFEESPLCPPRISRCGPETSEEVCDDTSFGADSTHLLSDSMRTTFVKRVSRSVSGIVEVARGLQSAYIAAAMFAAGPSSHDRHTIASQPRDTPRCRWQARREGYRAHAEDVKKFTTSVLPVTLTTEPVHFIPLSPFPVTPGAANPSTSRLAPGNAIIIPSPLRPRTPPAVLAYRMRPVGNPAVLRLRALQNLMCARGKEWEGRGREGGLGCGKERMLGVAFEGRGRSGLGCEVRFVVA
ncbi:hypothetical protein HYDPIDRAFT_26712 [Hydnomerulius pinastri MD-312]|nr:hypothetical protein HYDPIDRAFT_26712 [Hydnomerulius pinastri MD-312]